MAKNKVAPFSGHGVVFLSLRRMSLVALFAVTLHHAIMSAVDAKSWLTVENFVFFTEQVEQADTFFSIQRVTLTLREVEGSKV